MGGWYYSAAHCRALLFGSNIIFGHDSVVECHTQSDGHLVWAYGGKRSNIWMSDEMILDNARLYVDIAEREIVCLDPASGNALWDITLPDVGHFSWCFNASCQSPEAIFLGEHDGYTILAISKTTGAVIWQSEGVLPKGYDWSGDWGGQRSILSSPAYLDGAIYIGAELIPSTFTPNGCLTKLDAATGKILWTKYLPPGDSSTGYLGPYSSGLKDIDMNNGIIPYGHDLIFTAGICIARIDSSGAIIWRKAPSVRGSISDYFEEIPHIVNGRLYAYNSGGGQAFATAIDPETGQVIWTSQVSKTGESHSINSENAAFDSNNVYHVTDDEELVGQSMADGHVTLFCNMQYYYYSPLPNDSKYVGCLQFVGNRFFGIGDDSVYCYEIPR